MRVVLLLVAAVLLAGCIAVDTTREIQTAPPPPTPPILNSPEAAGKVALIETEPLGRGATLVTFGYENSTAMTLDRVTVRCRGFDKDGFQLAVQDVTIEGSSEGPIDPGFKIRKRIDLVAAGIESVTCVVYRAEAS